MSINTPNLINEANISIAWGKALLHVIENPRRKTTPLIVSVELPGSDALPENERIRSSLDLELEQHDLNTVEVCGMLIFPYKMWERRGRPDCDVFSKFCIERYLPRLKRADRRNQNGTYFQRIMSCKGEKREKVAQKRQLEFIISLLRKKKKPRESALQLGIFDPVKDHTGQPVRGFPCLQQVSISLDDAKGMAITGYYPSQYIFDRAYGNYLGLCHLGMFIAAQSGFALKRMTCISLNPILGSASKTKLNAIYRIVSDEIGKIQ